MTTKSCGTIIICVLFSSIEMEEEQHPKQKKVFAEVFNEILKSKERAKPIVDEDARKDTVAKRELRLKKSEALQLAHKPYSEWDSSIEKKNRVVATKAVSDSGGANSCTSLSGGTTIQRI